MQVSFILFKETALALLILISRLSVQVIKSFLARKCLKNENGDMLLKNLTKEAKRALSGLVLNLSNIEEQSLKLPEADRHLLTPPDDLPISKLYDLMHVIQLDRTPVQARTLYSRLVEKYYDLDRNLRVSASNISYI